MEGGMHGWREGEKEGWINGGRVVRQGVGGWEAGIWEGWREGGIVRRRKGEESGRDGCSRMGETASPPALN